MHKDIEPAPYVYSEIYPAIVTFARPMTEAEQLTIYQTYYEFEESLDNIRFINPWTMTIDFMLIPASNFTDEPLDINTFVFFLNALAYANAGWLEGLTHNVDLHPSTDLNKEEYDLLSDRRILG